MAQEMYESTSFCPKCGKRLEPGTRFCSGCGDPIESDRLSLQEQNVSQLTENDSMTINCPHCGGVMYKMLDTCPHCHGPVLSDALREEQDKKERLQQKDWEKYCQKVNRDEKLYFWGSVVLGLFLGIGLVFMALQTSSGDRDASYYLAMLLIPYIFAAMFYGLHCLHPIKRFPGLAGFPIIGWYFLLIIAVMAGGIIGCYYWFPRAIIRMVRKKPLLSEAEIEKLLDKDYIEA